MADMQILSPGDPEILRLLTDPATEEMSDWFDLQENLGGLSTPQVKLIGVVEDIMVLENRMGLGKTGRGVLMVVAMLVAAGVVYLASESWIAALAVGVLIGFYLGITLGRKK